MPTRIRWPLAALCAWTVFLWGNRISNAWGGDETTSAKVISTLLAASFLLFAIGGLVVLVRSWSAPLGQAAANFLLVFAGWTVVVWTVRIVGIAISDHGVGFKVVHAVLGLISIGLAIGAVRAIRRAPVESFSTAG